MRYMHEEFPTLVIREMEQNHGEIIFHTYLKGTKLQKTMSTAGGDVKQLRTCVYSW